MILPDWLNRALEDDYGREWERICGGLRKRPASFRLNSLKTDASALEAALAKAGISFAKTDWYAHEYLTENSEEELRALPAYENGELYLQSPSSALPPLFLDPCAGENILDMCAAPGGKTAQIYALSGGKAQITAVERDKIRFERMKYNFEKQDVNVNSLCEDALRLNDFMRFDKILLDAPCSGSGTLSPEKPLKISDKLVRNCAVLQEKLLKKALKLVKKGGIVVYSTCSVLKIENERVIEAALKTGSARLKAIDEERFASVPRLQGGEGTLTVCPDGTYEGFFVAVLEKTRENA